MQDDTIMVTGASDGIGAVYADRLARRGHRLVLVARRTERLEQVADRIRSASRVAVEALVADLGSPADLARVEARLRDDETIAGLVNNAGMAGEGPIVSAEPALLTALVNLNVLAVTRLTAAIAPRLARQGRGTIINLGSVTSLMPGAFSSVYPATKAFVLAFTEALQAELRPKGVRVQCVLPGVTRTAIWSDEQMSRLPPGMVMEAQDMVDAALAGLDRGESVTIPSLPDIAVYQAYVATRDELRPGLSLSTPAPRYRT
ncbi:MAG: SDR family oxidoreductase [Alsobacter sp.]